MLVIDGQAGQIPLLGNREKALCNGLYFHIIPDRFYVHSAPPQSNSNTGHIPGMRNIEPQSAAPDVEVPVAA
jgi:hypothetical protein